MIAATGLMLANGRYRLVSRIAVGGMGEVWRAHDLLADGPVAIKVLRPEFTGDQTSLKRLRIEARNASMLNHPNITKVHDYREHEGTGYLVMEYVDGQSLADVLAAHATIAPLRLLPILIQSALGLHAAHTAGVVHRDVKPGNILLGSSDHVKLTDFGISVAHGQLALTDTGKVMGTAQYLAPEQALGRAVTPAGDLYSLGVIAYESLAGHRPFGGVNYVAIALAQVNEPPPPLPGSVERSLADLVGQLLDKDPARRPADGAQLAARFGEVLETHRRLADRLLTSRAGGRAAILGPVGDRGGRPPGTAEQPAPPLASLKPPPAPATAASPVVESAPPWPPAPPGPPAPQGPPAPSGPPAPPGPAAPEGRPAHKPTAAPGEPPPAGPATPEKPPPLERRRAPEPPPSPGRPPAGAPRADAGDGIGRMAAPARLPPVARPVPPAPPLPSRATLAAPLERLAPAQRLGPAISAQPAARRPERARRARRRRDWIWAILVGIGLLIIIVIGFLNVLTADRQSLGRFGGDQTAPAGAAPVSIVSTVPELGPITER
ncbi:MAG: serine/threonine protein kinase [Bifidobacteriaceae bacterium]|jgi:serine/threonine-protein kinase|nr:serine/threonine protein kinase [Bifidobacteriaceae bacterium]